MGSQVPQADGTTDVHICVSRAKSPRVPRSQNTRVALLTRAVSGESGTKISAPADGSEPARIAECLVPEASAICDWGNLIDEEEPSERHDRIHSLETCSTLGDPQIFESSKSRRRVLKWKADR
jgi:hypothetical protein